MKFKCPECGSTNVYGLISISAKQKLNGKQKIYDVGHSEIDNYFETGGCEKCGWEGDIYVIENFSDAVNKGYFR